MRRAADAHATADGWNGWIVAAVGHGEDWARVFHAGLQDSGRLRSHRRPAGALLRSGPAGTSHHARLTTRRVVYNVAGLVAQPGPEKDAGLQGRAGPPE